MATNHKQTRQKTTHIAIQTRVEDTTLVGTLLLHWVLQHNLLLTLATWNEREVQPQLLMNSMRARGTRSGRHLLTILIFINYYKFLIF
jgi:hypothetical protein